LKVDWNAIVHANPHLKYDGYENKNLLYRLADDKRDGDGSLDFSPEDIAGLAGFHARCGQMDIHHQCSSGSNGTIAQCTGCGEENKLIVCWRVTAGSKRFDPAVIFSLSHANHFTRRPHIV
jgi:hypothetical protein